MSVDPPEIPTPPAAPRAQAAGLSAKPWTFTEAAILFCPFALPMMAAAFLPAAPGAPPRLTHALVDLVLYTAYAAVALGIVMNRHGLTLNQTIGLGEGRALRVIPLSIATGVLFVPVAFGLNLAAQFLLEQMALAPERQDLVKQFEHAAGSADHQVVLSLGLLAIVRAPLVEEVLFRGLLYPAAKNHIGSRAAMWLTSLLFAASHGSLLAAVPLAVFSVMLTWQYERTGNLLSPICTHAVFNLVNVLIMLKVLPLEDWLPHAS